MIKLLQKIFDFIPEISGIRDFMKRFTCILLISCTLHVTMPVHAADDSDIADASENLSGGRYATAPECGISMTDIGLILVSFIAAYYTMKYGFKLLIQAARDVNPITKLQKVIMGTLAYTTGLTSAITLAATSVLAACLMSFVRDPLYYDSTNTSRVRKKGGGMTSNLWEAQPAPYSEYVAVCARPMIPYTALIPDASCYRTGDITMNSSTAEDYDGEKCMLCPEEWRNMGFKRDTDDKGVIQSSKAILDPGSDKYNAELTEMKKTMGPLKCHVGKIGDNFALHGFAYTIRKKGSRVCGVIRGINLMGSVPPFSTPHIVGCHYGPPEPPEPMCPTSIAIRTDSTKNPDGTLQAGTGSGRIISYDNTSCMECYLSYWCQANAMKMTQAILSIAAPLLHCVQESMNLVLYGCRNMGGNQPGLLDAIQNRLGHLIEIIIALAVTFFAINALMGLGDFKSSDLWVMMLKIGFVIFMTTAGNATDLSGMRKLTRMTYTISSGIANIVTSAGVNNGLCQYSESDYILRIARGGYPVGSDYSYLMAPDMLDCMIFYLLGGTILTNVEINSGTLVNSALNMLLLPLTLIFSFFDILGAILVLIFNILILLLITWIVLFLILAIVGMALTSLLSVIFVPMILIGYTKAWFDAWLKEFISYHLIPIFLYGFLGFVFSLYSVMFYGQTKFVPVTVKVAGRNVKYFAIDQNHCFKVNTDPYSPHTGEEVQQCGCQQDKAGCKLAKLSFFTEHLIFGIKVTKVDARIAATDLALIVIITFILGRFLIIMPGLVVEISGGSRSFLTVSGRMPTTSKILSQALSGMKKLTSSKGKDKKDDKKEGGDKKDGDKDGGGASSDSVSSSSSSSGGGKSSDSISSGGGGGSSDSISAGKR